MKTEFNQQEIEAYVKNLTPAEKGCVDSETIMALETVLDMHFQVHDSISLIELISMTVDEVQESASEDLRSLLK